MWGDKRWFTFSLEEVLLLIIIDYGLLFDQKRRFIVKNTLMDLFLTNRQMLIDGLE